MTKGEQVTGDTQPPPCECQRTEPGRPCGETVAHLHVPMGSPQQAVCKAGPPHAPQEFTAFPSLPGLRLPSHRGFWPSRCLLISSSQLQPIAVPWGEGGHLLSFNVPQKPYGQATSMQSPPDLAAWRMAIVRDWDFLNSLAWILRPTVCTTVAGAIRMVGRDVLPAWLSWQPAAPAPPPRVPREPRRGARHRAQLPRAGRGLEAGANPPVCRPALHLAGHPSKTVRHGFPVGSPLRQTNPSSLNLPSKSPVGRRAAGREGAAAGLWQPGGEAGAITTLSFFRLILTSHFNLIEPCLASRLLARCVRGLGPDAAGR